MHRGAIREKQQQKAQEIRAKMKEIKERVGNAREINGGDRRGEPRGPPGLHSQYR